MVLGWRSSGRHARRVVQHAALVALAEEPTNAFYDPGRIRHQVLEPNLQITPRPKPTPGAPPGSHVSAPLKSERRHVAVHRKRLFGERGGHRPAIADHLDELRIGEEAGQEADAHHVPRGLVAPAELALRRRVGAEDGVDELGMRSRLIARDTPSDEVGVQMPGLEVGRGENHLEAFGQWWDAANA